MGLKMNFFQELINTYNKGLRYDTLNKDYLESCKVLKDRETTILVERTQFTLAIEALEDQPPFTELAFFIKVR